MHVREMISTHPDVQGSTADKLLRCIAECYSCAQTCTACADACLAESMVDELRQTENPRSLARRMKRRMCTSLVE
jgi:hypothetical protein